LFHQMIGQWYIAVTRPGVVSLNVRTEIFHSC
jgi:hypothetical protein